MVRVFLADARPEERSSMRQILLGLQMEVVGEAADWPTTLAQLSTCPVEQLVVDWDLLPAPPGVAFDDLRKASANNLVIVLTSRFDVRRQAALSIGADVFISREEPPERVVECLRKVAANIRQH